MEIPEIRTTTQADESPAIDAIVLAFVADPVARWCYPDPHQYLTNMPRFARAFAGSSFAHGSAHCTGECAGTALWLPPDVHPDEEALGEVIESTVSESVRTDLYAVFEQLAGYHPAEPHWYLPLIGVDPAYRGKGIGGALMKYAAQQCDHDQTPAYLESTNPRNVSLYQRHGFEVLGEVQVGTSPPFVPMLRPAR